MSYLIEDVSINYEKKNEQLYYIQFLFYMKIERKKKRKNYLREYQHRFLGCISFCLKISWSEKQTSTKNNKKRKKKLDFSFFKNV